MAEYFEISLIAQEICSPKTEIENCLDSLGMSHDGAFFQSRRQITGQET